MGTKILKFLAYVALFIMSFAIFLYWCFPYEVLKDRITGMIEQQIGGDIEVTIRDLKPYWFTGVDISGFTISQTGGGASQALLECKRVIARASLLSLIFGRVRVAYDIEVGKGEISGTYSQADDALGIDADFDDFDIGNLKLIAARTGLNITSRITGNVSLKIDKQNPMQSSGKIVLELKGLNTATSEVKLGEVSLPLPDLVLSQGRESLIKMDIGKGVISVDSMKLAGGDLTMDLKGKIFLSTKVENYRFNLNGTFAASKKLGDALPYLFIVEQQKQQDGNYPLSVTGRLVKPTIKVGTFTVPL